MLVDFSLGAEMWKKASVKISEALIYITEPSLTFLDVFGLPRLLDEQQKPSNIST